MCIYFLRSLTIKNEYTTRKSAKDVNTISFYVTGRLVYDRIKEKSVYIPAGSGVPLKLPGIS